MTGGCYRGVEAPIHKGSVKGCWHGSVSPGMMRLQKHWCAWTRQYIWSNKCPGPQTIQPDQLCKNSFKTRIFGLCRVWSERTSWYWDWWELWCIPTQLHIVSNSSDSLHCLMPIIQRFVLSLSNYSHGSGEPSHSPHKLPFQELLFLTSSCSVQSHWFRLCQACLMTSLSVYT
jgi:hypothetical protein